MARKGKVPNRNQTLIISGISPGCVSATLAQLKCNFVAFLEERGSAEPEASVELALVAAAAAVAADAPVAAEVVFVALLAAAEVVFVPLPFPSSLYTSMKSPTQRNAINLT